MQKMEAFLQSLSQMHPNVKFDFLLSFKESKDFAPMLGRIVPFAKRIFYADFALGQDVSISSVPFDDVRTALAETAFTRLEKVDDLDGFLSDFPIGSLPLVITGSLYFSGVCLQKTEIWKKKQE